DFETDERWFLRALNNVGISANFKFSVQLQKNPNCTADFKIELIKQDGSTLATLLDQEADFPGSSYNETFEIDTTIPLELVADEKLSLMATVRVTSGEAGVRGADM